MMHGLKKIRRGHYSQAAFALGTLHFQFNGENKDWLDLGRSLTFEVSYKAGKKVVLVWNTPPVISSCNLEGLFEA